MDAQDIRAVLADPVAQELYAAAPIGRLAYTGTDGGPRVIPTGYALKDGRFVMATSTNAPKVRALQRDPRVALTIDTDAFPPKVLLVRGTAEVEIVDGIPDEFLDASRGAVPPEQFAEWEAGVRGLYEQMARIAITPTWAKILDFETRVPQAVEELARQKGAL